MPETVLPEVMEARLVRGKSLWVSLRKGVHGGASHAWATLPCKATPCNSSCPGRAAVLDQVSLLCVDLQERDVRARRRGFSYWLQ